MAEADELFKDTGGGTQPQKKSEADSLFAAQAGLSLDPKRAMPNVDSGIGPDDNHGDLDDIMANSRKKSDIEIVIAKLFPEFPAKWLNALLVSRVFPDAFNHMQWLCVKELVATTKMTVVEAVAYVYAVLSIAIDGEGRIDGIHIIGQGGQSEETKAKSNAGMV